MNAKSLIELLDTLAIWRTLKPLPDEVRELRQRVEALEARLGAAAVGGLQQCPLCSSMQFKRTASKEHPQFGFAGIKLDTYLCQKCGHQEERERNEGAR